MRQILGKIGKIKNFRENVGIENSKQIKLYHLAGIEQNSICRVGKS